MLEDLAFVSDSVEVPLAAVPPGKPPCDLPDDWLLKKLMEEHSLALRTVWDLYLKFYTVFLGFNIAAFAGTVQYITKQPGRRSVSEVFIAENMISLVTAVGMAIFSMRSSQAFARTCRHYASRLGLEPESAEQLGKLTDPPWPGTLGLWGGTANAISHFALGYAWWAIMDAA